MHGRRKATTKDTKDTKSDSVGLARANSMEFPILAWRDSRADLFGGKGREVIRAEGPE